MDRVLPAWKCEGVGDGLQALAYKMTAEAIFLGFVYGVVQWFLAWVYGGLDKLKQMSDVAIKAYDDLCSTTA